MTRNNHYNNLLLKFMHLCINTLDAGNVLLTFFAVCYYSVGHVKYCSLISFHFYFTNIYLLFKRNVLKKLIIEHIFKCKIKIFSLKKTK